MEDLAPLPLALMDHIATGGAVLGSEGAQCESWMSRDAANDNTDNSLQPWAVARAMH